LSRERLTLSEIQLRDKTGRKGASLYYHDENNEPAA